MAGGYGKLFICVSVFFLTVRNHWLTGIDVFVLGHEGKKECQYKGSYRTSVPKEGIFYMGDFISVGYLQEHWLETTSYLSSVDPTGVTLIGRHSSYIGKVLFDSNVSFQV